MCLHDPVDHREAKASAVTLLARGEERVEDACLRLRTHADAVVGHLHAHEATRGQHTRCLEADADTGTSVIDLNVDLAHPTRASCALPQRVHGIGAQIHHDLVQLSGIAHDERFVGLQHRIQFDAGGNGRTQQASRLLHGVGYCDR